MAGELVFFQVEVPDTGKAQAFYGSLFGWRFEPGNFPDYYMIPNATPLAGLGTADAPSRPKVFFGVDDIDAGTARVRELGGTAGEPVTIPSGRFAECVDDQGTEFLLWQNR